MGFCGFIYQGSRRVFIAPYTDTLIQFLHDDNRIFTHT